MRLRDVVDELHDEHGLADAGAAEEADFAAFAVRSQQIDDLDTGLEDFDFRRLVDELRRVAVNRRRLGCVDRTGLVDGLANDVQDAAEALGADGHHDGRAGIANAHAAREAVRRVHGNGADRRFAEMLSDLENEVVGFARDARIRDDDRVEDARELTRRELDVDDGTDDLRDRSNGHGETMPPRNAHHPGARRGTPNTPRCARLGVRSRCVVGFCRREVGEASKGFDTERLAPRA